MRFSEGLAISLADLFQGELPTSQMISKKLKNYGITYYGYIAADAQLNEKGERVPFKGKKEISERNVRLIPIIDKELWNSLVALTEEQYEKWKNTPSLTKKAFNLFSGINDTTATNRLQESFASCKIKYKK